MPERVKIAVAGGTGLVGGHVVKSLHDSGAEPVVLARSYGVDLLTGKGLAEALAGIDAVIDVSNPGTLRRAESMTFFTRTTEHLLEAGRRAGVRHHVALSIVGCDRVPAGYYEAKRRQEQLVLAGGVPGTVLRATQFHEFAEQILARASVGPVAVAPRMRVQPVAAAEVAEALVALVHRPALGMALEIAGPKEEHVPDMVRRLIRRRGSRRVLLAVRMPGAAGRAIANGALLPGDDGLRGEQDFAQWLIKPDEEGRGNAH
jgi:uncharacterized protein YbjT (DUF2867 family)